MRKFLLCAIAVLVGILSLPRLRAQPVTTPPIAALACAYNTVVPTPVSGQFALVQCNSSGQLLTNGLPATGGTLTGMLTVNANILSTFGSSAEDVLIGGVASADTFPGIWFGTNGAAPSYTNYSFLYDPGPPVNVNLNGTSGIAFRVGGTRVMTMNANGLAISAGAVSTTVPPAGTSLTTTGRVGVATAAPATALDITGGVSLASSLLTSSAAPTIGTCTGSTTNGAIGVSNGPSSFTIVIGTGTITNSCTVNLPTAAHGWNCWANDISTNSTTVFITKQSASTVSSATFINYTDIAGTGTAWTAGDTLNISCFGN